MSDPGICPTCKGAMKPLFTGFYCPKDCDKPGVRKAALDKEIAAAQDLTARPRMWVTPAAAAMPGPFIYRGAAPVPNYTPPMADDQCRDFYCSGKGMITHTHYKNLGLPNSVMEKHYKCGTCSKPWQVDDASWNQTPAAAPVTNFARPITATLNSMYRKYYYDDPAYPARISGRKTQGPFHQLRKG